MPAIQAPALFFPPNIFDSWFVASKGVERVGMENSCIATVFAPSDI
jgi:hypothetical protein